MNSSQLILRAISPADAEILFAWRQEPIVKKYNPLDDLSQEELRTHLSKTSSDLKDRTASNYRWMLECDGRPIGSVALSNVSWRMGYGEIGYAIGESYHKKGFGKLAVKLLTKKIFSETDLNKLIAYVAEENLASRKILEGLNFYQEGFLRDHYLIQDKRVNEVLYALFRKDMDWPDLA